MSKGPEEYPQAPIHETSAVGFGIPLCSGENTAQMTGMLFETRFPPQELFYNNFVLQSTVPGLISGPSKGGLTT